MLEMFSVIVILFLFMLLFTGRSKVVKAANPYLPLWEHIPDAEPYVFEDPDKPGNTVYISMVPMIQEGMIIVDTKYQSGLHQWKT